MWQGRIAIILATFFWGSNFIAQRQIADVMSATGYNAIRFALGALTVLPLIFIVKDLKPQVPHRWPTWVAGLLAAFFLCTGSTLQQIAIAYTTASKAAFITALYIVLVPLAGLFLGHHLSLLAFFGVIFATIGAGFLTLQGDFTIAWADGLLLISTLFWVGHILLLNSFSKRFSAFPLAFWQFLAASAISSIMAYIWDPVTIDQAMDSWFALFWGGVLSVGVGFTGQLIGQRQVPPTEASLLMSLEMVFATILGFLWLNESLSSHELIGVFLMSIGIVLAQLPSRPLIKPLRGHQPI